MNMDSNKAREYERIIDENIRLLQRLKHTFCSKDFNYKDEIVITVNKSKIQRIRKIINENLMDLERGKLWNY